MMALLPERKLSSLPGARNSQQCASGMCETRDQHLVIVEPRDLTQMAHADHLNPWCRCGRARCWESLSAKTGLRYNEQAPPQFDKHWQSCSGSPRQLQRSSSACALCFFDSGSCVQSWAKLPSSC